LDDLPDWLPELGLEFTYCEDGINLRGTKVFGADMTLFSEKIADQNFAQHQELIREWFTAQKEEVAKPLNEIKVVFLGDGESGKSHTIARLLNDGGDPVGYIDSVTPGIVVHHKEYDLDGRKIQVHYWDFGGQEIMHSMHRMFLTERTLYVVMLNARDDTQSDRARYWLHNIHSFAKDAPVILVLNKIDQNLNASVNEPDLRARYSGLKEIVRLSALKFNRDEFNTILTASLMRQIEESGYLDTEFPAAWKRLKDKLSSLSDDYILADEYSNLCDSCGIEAASETRKELLHWFDDLGFLFYSD
jgi:small GTP-binding protein